MTDDKYEEVFGNSHWDSLKTIDDVMNVRIPSAVTRLEAKFIYDTVRTYKPECVVETGSGKSSLAILSALKDNGKGLLHSIDLPNLEGCRAHKSNKNAVNELWRAILKVYPQWDIREKDICKELPLLLDELPAIDLFFHDSRHTHEHLTLEWNLLMQSKKLITGGLFGMHDTTYPPYKKFITKLRNNKNFISVGFHRAAEFWQMKENKND